MSGGTVSQPKTSAAADTKQEMQNYLAGGAATAKVTLVKPAQSDETAQQETMEESNSSGKLSYARPKVGRASAGLLAQESKPASMAREEGKPMELPPIPRDLAAVTSTRPWDFKFALLLVSLFVAVNLGLIMLLHTSHHAPQHINNEAAAIKTQKSAVEKAAVPAVTLPEATATTSAETLAVPPVPPALPVAPQASALPVATPPAVPAAPVVANLPPAIPAAEAPAPAAPVAAAPASVVPAATAASVAPASATAPASSSQDLLSIIGKN